MEWTVVGFGDWIATPPFALAVYLSTRTSWTRTKLDKMTSANATSMHLLLSFTLRIVDRKVNRLVKAKPE